MAGRPDTAALKRSHRRGRERGCHVYISGEELEEAGISLDGPPPLYRFWPGRKRTIMVQLYEAPERRTPLDGALAED